MNERLGRSSVRAATANRIGRAMFAGMLGLAIAASSGRAWCGETGVFAGSVHDGGGRAVAGVMVTLTNRALGRATTVFSSADGRFRLPPLEAGNYDLRLRRPGYMELEQTALALADGTTRLDLRIAAETDPRELAWQLPASRWMPLVLSRLSSDSKREEFTRQCGYCHQQGSWATRVPRSRDDWEAIFTRMARMGGNVSADLRAELPRALDAAYDENSYVKALTEPEFVPPAPPQGPAARAIITEWSVGSSASMLHDITVHRDGSVWAVDTATDRLYRLDPRSGERRGFAIPTGDSPVGGVFHSSGLLQSPGSAARVAPHSLQVAADGTIWVTLCLGNKVAHFEPRNATWTIYPQKEGLYPHTLRIDRKGRIWYTLAVSNHVGMIDPASGEQRTYRLPARDLGQALATRALPLLLWASDHLSLGTGAGGEGATLPVPYGIDIAPDGGVWFSQLNVHRIGRLDPESGAVKIIETPFPGPRRLRFDSKGNLWIPGFSAGLIARYRPATGEFKTFKLPTGGIETPYALNVDRRNDTIWICGTASDSLISFDPRSESFTVYPLPTRVTFTREIDFDREGGVWTSNSNFPAWQIEAPNPSIIRLQAGAAPRPD